ncbi:fungal-specific transcription factor domain-containing protein [Trichoderma evansii]
MSPSIPQSSEPPSQRMRNRGGHGKRHCWECRRRCLVCDSEEPGCKRCHTSGIPCPGYGDVKPTRLKWITPGRVVSREQKQKKTLRRKNQDDQEEITEDMIRHIISVENYMHITLPHFEMNDEVQVIVQALDYFNSCIYKDLAPIHDFGQNPYLYQISAKHLQAARLSPDYLKYGMLCMIMSHRINQTSNVLHLKPLVEKFYFYWGLAVRSLNDYLNKEDKRAGNTIIAGILTLLLADIHQGRSLDWRCHLGAIYKLITLRGGFYVLYKSTSMKPLMLCFWFIAVIGDTTCPASDLFLANLHIEALSFLLEKYSIMASQIHLCPIQLFPEIFRINHLRKQGARPDIFDTKALQEVGYEILERINSFSPQKLAESKHSCQEDWILVGRAYQAAVALYCILSLQSLSVLPQSSALRIQCAEHGAVLQILLKEALASKRLKRFMVWPLVVLGVEAVHGGGAMRTFVASQLSELSYDAGTYVPLTAERALEQFWSSGDTRWDVCFGRPYIFTLQIAVDTSRLMPLYE